jgi:peptidylprolyl isomerase
MTRTNRFVAGAALAFAALATLATATPPNPPATPPEQPAEEKPAPAADKPATEQAEPIRRTVMESGLVIEDLKIGEGKEVKPGGSVEVHYLGTLKDGGTKFDSSYDRNEPIVFALGGVIKGWQEGVPGMRVGGKRRLIVPSEMAYGERGAPPVIGPNADLVFEIELLDAVNTEDMATDLEEGSGEEAVQMGDTVQVHYTGTLADGTKFDSSHDRGQPATFPLGRVIPGWQTGMLGMKVGGKRKLVIPWKFAYGEQGRPPRIPPKADLTFEIELLNVTSQQR